MRSLPRVAVTSITSIALGAALAAHIDASWPLSSVNGRWQVQDWYEHPDATREQLAAYADARSQYPRQMVIKPFWRASVGSARCSWSQHVAAWSLPPGLAEAWTTTVRCPGMHPITMYVPPSNLETNARSVASLYRFYAEMGSVPIEVVFHLDRGFSYIDYIPASWPGKPAHLTNRSSAAVTDKVPTQRACARRAQLKR